MVASALLNAPYMNAFIDENGRFFFAYSAFMYSYIENCMIGFEISHMETAVPDHSDASPSSRTILRIMENILWFLASVAGRVFKRVLAFHKGSVATIFTAAARLEELKAKGTGDKGIDMRVTMKCFEYCRE